MTVSQQKAVVIGRHNQRKEIHRVMHGYSRGEVSLHEHETVFAAGVHQYITSEQARWRDNPKQIIGYAGTHDLDSLVAAILNETSAQASAYQYTSAESLLKAQNKFYSRSLQRQVVPEATPSFELGSRQLQSAALSYPLFVKPVFSTVSQSSGVVCSEDDLRDRLEHNKAALKERNRGYEELQEHGFLPDDVPLLSDEFICEELISGEQLTIDGYVHESNVVFLGITSSHFLPDTLSFERFEYPKAYDEILRKSIEEISRRFVLGSGLRNCLFNIEFMLEPEKGSVKILELNTRLSFQFAYLIEAVTGQNPLEILFDLALGLRPDKIRRAGGAKCAVSHVMRTQHDSTIKRLPTSEEIANLKKSMGEFCFTPLAAIGEPLSRYPQDEHTYRYAFLDISGNSFEEIAVKRRELEAALPLLLLPA